MRCISIFLASCALAATLLRAEPASHPDFLKSKFGFFVHYVWAGKNGGLTIDATGNRPASLDAFAEAFDVERFANELSDWQVEYLVFTAWHANINVLFPSETMRKWGLNEHTCNRDLLAEIIKACKAKNIAVVLYTHPRDGYDLHGDERTKTGWGEGSGAGPADPDWSQFDYQKWNDFTNELYAEVVDRYGKDISGLFLDEASSAGDSHRVIDYPRLRETIKSRAPHLVLQQNYYGSLYSCDVGVKEYHHWQQFENRDGGAWPAWDIPVAAVFATTWWAARPAGENTVVYSAEDMFRYTVLQAGANTHGGGMQWAAGPYAGGGWETGVAETMTKFASYMKPVAPSIKGTVASKAFPTQKGAHSKTSAGACAPSSGASPPTHPTGRSPIFTCSIHPPAKSSASACPRTEHASKARCCSPPARLSRSKSTRPATLSPCRKTPHGTRCTPQLS